MIDILRGRAFTWSWSSSSPWVYDLLVFDVPIAPSMEASFDMLEWAVQHEHTQGRFLPSWVYDFLTSRSLVTPVTLAKVFRAKPDGSILELCEEVAVGTLVRKIRAYIRYYQTRINPACRQEDCDKELEKINKQIMDRVVEHHTSRVQLLTLLKDRANRKDRAAEKEQSFLRDWMFF